MRKKMSVIIPAYNMENYLGVCLDSVFGQTLDDFEVIVINDCSKDKTESVVNEYRKKHDNLKYINNKVNMGVSASRNIGISNSEGEYIVFLDSDDYIEKDMLKSLYDECKKGNLDMAICGYFINFSDGNIKQINLKLDNNKIYSGVEMLKELLTHKNGVTGHSWNKIIKRDILIDNNLKYPEDMKVYEDVIFFTSIYPYFNKIKYVDKSLYHYIERSNSAIRTVDDRLINDTKLSLERVEEDLISNNYKDKLELEFAAFYSRMISIAIHKLYTYSSDDHIRRKYLSRLIGETEFEFGKYNAIMKEDYIYDKFHKMALESFKYSNGSSTNFDSKYKKLYNRNEMILKCYKIVRPIIKLIKS